MKNKLIVFFAFAGVLFFPFVSRAYIIIPDVTINIIVNTQGQDAPFNFSLKTSFCECDEESCHYTWKDYKTFNLQTQNLSASASTAESAWGTKYLLTQENIPAGLKIKDINCTTTDPNNQFFHYPNGIEIIAGTVTSGQSITCTFNNVKAITPVLIVPGLMGTEIKDGEELLWADMGRMAVDVNDSFVDPLSFNKNLIPSDSDVYASDVIKTKTLFGATVYNYSGELINEFKGQGYIEGTGADATLFTFPYDWRYGASGKYANGKTNSDLLKEKIQQILQQTGSDKVDVVAHSLGGLIVKKYVASAQGAGEPSKINKAVFVGVPNTGAPKSVKVLLQGDNFGVPWLADSEIKKISENMPAAYDLLPSQQYYNQKGSFIKTINEDIFNLTYSEKDLNYLETESFLINDHQLNSAGFDKAENLHTEAFDNFDMRTAGVDLYAIDGCKAGTLGAIIEKSSKNVFGGTDISYNKPKLIPGDGTVPLESATNLPIDQNKKYYSLSGKHSKMLSADGSRQKIVNLISGSNLNIANNLISQNINECNLNGKAISVFSPVDIFVTDQNGNRLGLAEDKSIINEIPNADFELMGDHKFVYLPQDGGEIYSINLTGTDNGTFTIKSQDIINSQGGTVEVFNNLPVTPTLTGGINFNADNSTTLLIKETPNSQLKTISPSATLTEQEANDITPPVAVATLIGVLGQPSFYRSDVSAEIKAADNESGVLSISYNLDNAGYQKVLGETLKFSVTKEGKHAITFFATDNAGNNSAEQTMNFEIDKTSPETIIQFDLTNKDLKFSSIENNITILDKDNKIILTDQAGNTTEINLKDKNRKILMQAEIKSIKYNGVPADISKNKMAFLWLYDKNKNLKMLSQHVQSKKGYNILAVYEGKKTKFVGKDASGLILKSFGGLKLLKITTNKGDLQWSY